MDLNAEVINNAYKNAHIALQSISDLMPECPSTKMREELQTEHDGYEKIIGEISEYMKSNNIEPKYIGVMKKAMLWTSIKMNAMTDDSRSHLAEMMLKGTIMGITELMQLLTRSDGKVKPEILALVEKLKNLEEEYEENLKALL